MSSIVNKNITSYIDEVCLLVKNKKVHKAIKEELENHILEIADMYIEQGLSEEEAINKSINRMGSAITIGNDLNKVHKTTSDILLTIITCALIFFGLFTLGYMELNNHVRVNEDLIKNSIIFILIGLFFAILIYKADYRNLKKYSKYIYIACVVLCSITILSEASHTTYMYFFTFEISLKNLIVFGFVVSMAGLADNFDFSNKKNITYNIILTALPSILILKGTNSVSLCLLYTISVLVILISSGIKFRYIVTSLLGVFSFFFIYIIGEPYRRHRLLNFFNYYTSNSNDDYNYGFIYTQLENVRNSATLLGNGGNFPSDMFSTPHCNFTLSYIIYCFGWLATIVLLVAILWFIIRIGFISKNSKNSYGKLLTAGLCSFFLIQFTISILTTFGLLPYIDISLPFISYSGSQLIISIVSISLINNVYKWRNTNSFIENIS